jgi:nicotinamide-nucleotide amidase
MERDASSTGRLLIADDDRLLLARVVALGDALRRRGWHLATAESCTGGLLAGACTSPPGASDWFEAGFVTYSNAAKEAQLGVAAALLARHGAVSAEVAEARAYGALARAGVDLAISVTGVAGPGGGSIEKPVGTVWLGWAWRAAVENTSLGIQAAPAAIHSGTEGLHLQGDRATIRAQTVAAAIERLLCLAGATGEAGQAGEAA